MAYPGQACPATCEVLNDYSALGSLRKLKASISNQVLFFFLSLSLQHESLHFHTVWRLYPLELQVTLLLPRDITGVNVKPTVA